MKGHLEVVNLLVKSGAKLESNQDLGLTPLIFAAATGHYAFGQAPSSQQGRTPPPKTAEPR